MTENSKLILNLKTVIFVQVSPKCDYFGILSHKNTLSSTHPTKDSGCHSYCYLPPQGEFWWVKFCFGAGVDGRVYFFIVTTLKSVSIQIRVDSM